MIPACCWIHAGASCVSHVVQILFEGEHVVLYFLHFDL